MTSTRPLTIDPPHRPIGDLVFRSPPNWTAVLFFAVLATLHFCICIPAFFRGRWEGYMSLTFALIFCSVSAACLRFKSEMTILAGEKVVRLCTRLGRFRCERVIPFASIRGVRLTLYGDAPRAESHIELLCTGDDIQCPPTSVPREEALCLAMTMNVPLIKAFTDDFPESRRLHDPSRD